MPIADVGEFIEGGALEAQFVGSLPQHLDELRVGAHDGDLAGERGVAHAPPPWCPRQRAGGFAVYSLGGQSRPCHMMTPRPSGRSLGLRTGLTSLETCQPSATLWSRIGGTATMQTRTSAAGVIEGPRRSWPAISGAPRFSRHRRQHQSSAASAPASPRWRAALVLYG